MQANMIKNIEGLINFKSKVILIYQKMQLYKVGLTRDQFEAQVERMMREGGYLRRLYRIYNDKNYKIQPQAKKK